jgi:hypothetical protein
MLSPKAMYVRVRLLPVARVAGTAISVPAGCGTVIATEAPAVKYAGRLSGRRLADWAPDGTLLTVTLPPLAVTPVLPPMTTVTPGSRTDSSGSAMPFAFSS